MIYYDTETCGLHGPIVLIQYAVDDEPVIMHNPWKATVQSTINVIEEIMNHREGVVGFNLAFDQFHLSQMYTTLLLIKDKTEWLEDCIEEYAMCEPEARLGPCLKPHNAIDLMIHARKGPYQSTMDRSDIRIKRVPSQVAPLLADWLNHNVRFKDVYFARNVNKTQWRTYDILDDVGDTNPDFRDVCVKFAPSSALKALCADIGLTKPGRFSFADIALSKEYRPNELGYAPFALALGSPDNWGKTWVRMIKFHIDHWEYNENARIYAEADVNDTRNLYRYFSALSSGFTESESLKYALGDYYGDEYRNVIDLPLGDDDSVLACMVGSVRWHGYKLDLPAIRSLRNRCTSLLSKYEFNFNSPEICKRYLLQVISEVEQMALTGDNGKISTKGIILEHISKWTMEEVCDDCGGMGCDNCDCGLVASTNPHPAATRAREILDFRHAKKEIELYDKLLKAGRFHASFKVTGTLSNRMSGGDGLNPQGIKRTTEVRECFPLADDEFNMCGGDFAGSQVVIADAVYKDPKLHLELLSGKKIHGLFGVHLFPPMTYDEICATKGLPNEQDKYSRSKNGVFAMLFGGEAFTLQNRVGIDEAAANDAYNSWIKNYKVWGQERQKYFDMFCSMRQPDGLGTKVEWHEPSDYIESMYGFKRYFTLENRICRALFGLAESPPKDWEKLRMRVVRRDRVQTAVGAMRSALFAAAFATQAANMRAAANHVIQSPEATVVKSLQREIWDIQPAGIGEWFVLPLNIHDEVIVPCKVGVEKEITELVANFIEKTSELIPLIEIDWSEHLDTWADK